jgi:TRAP-type mannitol/chloroaromatic compound transport system substrate-binding protein
METIPITSRRRFIASGAAAGIAAGLAACGKASTGPAVHTTQRVRWRLASSYPRFLDTIYGTAEHFAERLSQMTDGNFSIRVHPAGELAALDGVLDVVQSGGAEIGQTAGYYYTGKQKALAFDTTVPFGLNARQQSAWLHEAGGLSLLNEAYADFGVMSLPGGNTGAQMGGWYRKPVNSPEDFRGLKIRIPGLGGEVFGRLGAIVQNIGAGEIYSALERGALDATEWVGPYDDLRLKFYEVAKHYYYPGWWEPGPSISFLINLNAWKALPVAYQAALRAAAAEAEALMIHRYDARNPAALRELMDHGVQLHRYSDDMLRAADGIMKEIHRENAAQNPVYAKIHAAWSKFQTDSDAWFGVGEQAYQSYRSTNGGK